MSGGVPEEFVEVVQRQEDALRDIEHAWAFAGGQCRAPERAAEYVEELQTAAERLARHCKEFLELVR